LFVFDGGSDADDSCVFTPFNKIHALKMEAINSSEICDTTMISNVQFGLEEVISATSVEKFQTRKTAAFFRGVTPCGFPDRYQS
jgi:hypothetical protein